MKKAGRGGFALPAASFSCGSFCRCAAGRRCHTVAFLRRNCYNGGKAGLACKNEREK